MSVPQTGKEFLESVSEVVKERDELRTENEELKLQLKKQDKVIDYAGDVGRALIEEVERERDQLKAQLEDWKRLANDSACTHQNILRGTVALSREQALHIAGAQDYDELRAQLADFHAAMEKEKSPEWIAEVRSLAERLRDIPHHMSREQFRSASIHLDELWQSFTHKANFVPAQLEIKELKAQLAEREALIKSIDEEPPDPTLKYLEEKLYTRGEHSLCESIDNAVAKVAENAQLKAQLENYKLHYAQSVEESTKLEEQLEQVQRERDSARKACGDNVSTQIRLIEEHNSTLAKLSRCERDRDQLKAQLEQVEKCK